MACVYADMNEFLLQGEDIILHWDRGILVDTATQPAFIPKSVLKWLTNPLICMS